MQAIFNVAFPIFGVILTGYLAGRWRILGGEATTGLNAFVSYFALPVLFFGRDFWERVVDFDALVDEGVIAPNDLDLFTFCETAEEAWDCVCRYYAGSADALGCP